MTKMKVAMIGLRGLEQGLGGVETAIRELAPRLVKQGVDLTCYCRGQYNTKSDYEGVRLVNSPTLYSKHLETACYSFWSLMKACQEDYDVIHLHALASSSLAWIPKLFNNKCKIVTTIHGLDWQRAKWGPFARSLLKGGEWSIANFADCSICVSLSLQIYFSMRYPGKRFVYIPNGSDKPLGDFSPPNGLDKKKYFLYMGRIVPEKGIHRLIEAYRTVKTDYPLVIAGPTSYADTYVKQLQTLSAGDQRIRFVGSISGEEKERYLSNAYLFVLPSEIEGLPVALLEAASRGVCPAISNIPTAMEVLGSNELSRGFVFDPYVKEQIKNVLEVSLNCPDLVDKLGETAAEFVQLNFNWDLIAKNTKKVYDQIVETG